MFRSFDGEQIRICRLRFSQENTNLDPPVTSCLITNAVTLISRLSNIPSQLTRFNDLLLALFFPPFLPPSPPSLSRALVPLFFS